jgi:uncharacterized damage-inducible protein DinB
MIDTLSLNMAAPPAGHLTRAGTDGAILEGANEAELNTPRRMISDPGQTRLLRPADVIMRVVTHIFNHQGQVLAMCRSLGTPNDMIDLDYPVD